MDKTLQIGDLEVTAEEVDEALAHYGILGMRWGVRKGKGTPRAKSADAQSARNLRKKSASELSNQEIEAYLKRARLEKQYKTVTATRREKAVAAIKKQVSNTLKQAGQRASKVVVKEVLEPELAKRLAEAQARAAKARGG